MDRVILIDMLEELEKGKKEGKENPFEEYFEFMDICIAGAGPNKKRDP